MPSRVISQVSERFGFEFTRDICRAIGLYTASAEKEYSRAYFYRGMHLRYAVERWLYIHCINSDPLYRYYTSLRTGGAEDVRLSGLSPIESDIAFFLKAHSSTEKAPKRSRRVLVKAFARRVYGWLRRCGRSAAAPKIFRGSADILIQVVNAKFANYMAPVTRLLDADSYAYLVTADSALRVQLESFGQPVVDAISDEASLQHVFCSPYLADYVQLMRDADATLSALRMISPQCVVVVEGNAPMDVLTSEAARVSGIPCFCVQQGWSPYVHSGFRNMRFTEMFVWGQRFADILTTYNPNQVFSVTGSHAIRPPVKSSQMDAVKIISFYLQSPCALLSARAYYDFLDFIVGVASAYPYVQVVVREHPGYPLSSESRSRIAACPNVRFSIPSVESLADTIAESDMVVSIFSTVLLEAMAMNVVPLICSIGEMPVYEPPIAKDGAALEVFSIKEAHRVIDEVIAEPGRLASIRESMEKISVEFFSPQNAAETIATRLSRASRRKIARE